MLNQMKTKITSVVLLIVSTATAYAQNPFTNGGFETWVDRGDYQDPENWYSLNPLVVFGYQPSTTLSSDAYSGNNAVQLKSQASPFQDIPGLMASGPILTPAGDVDFSQIKFAFSARPKSLVFYYKYAPADGDSCNFYMALTKWNESTQKTDTIGDVVFQKGDSVNEYTRVEANINYYTNAQPDSALLIITSSIDGFNPYPGSTLLIDELSLSYSTGIANDEYLKEVKVYPNPVNDVLFVSNTKSKLLKVKLTSLLGETLHDETCGANSLNINMQHFSSGIYLLEITTYDGVVSKKIIKN